MSKQLQALELWRRSLVESVRGDAPDLSARQFALLLSVYLGPGPHTVRGLARALNVSKPAVSRALDRLGELGYIRRERDDLDRRNVLVQRTQAGAKFLLDFSAIVSRAEAEAARLADEKALDSALEAMSSLAGGLSVPSLVGEAGEASWADAAA